MPRVSVWRDGGFLPPTCPPDLFCTPDGSQTQVAPVMPVVPAPAAPSNSGVAPQSSTSATAGEGLRALAVLLILIVIGSTGAWYFTSDNPRLGDKAHRQNMARLLWYMIRIGMEIKTHHLE
jgi:hypothetical protein